MSFIFDNFFLLTFLLTNNLILLSVVGKRTEKSLAFNEFYQKRSVRLGCLFQSQQKLGYLVTSGGGKVFENCGGLDPF